jgi:hypothetical protein
LTVETLGRVHGAREFINALDVALPTAQLHADDQLRIWAEEQGWDPAEYFSEQQILNEQYRSWIPRYARYAAVVLLHSIVETQLFACADHVQVLKGVRDIKDRKRRGLDRGRRALLEASRINAGNDPGWRDLLRLEELRHIIVHRGGNIVTDSDRKLAERLTTNYSGKLWIVEAEDFQSAYIGISPGFCADFSNLVTSFFHWLLPKVSTKQG